MDTPRSNVWSEGKRERRGRLLLFLIDYFIYVNNPEPQFAVAEAPGGAEFRRLLSRRAAAEILSRLSRLFLFSLGVSRGDISLFRVNAARS